MTDKEHEHKEEVPKTSAPFTPEQEARIRAIVDEQIAKYEQRKIRELRFGTPFPPKEHK